MHSFYINNYAVVYTCSEYNNMLVAVDLNISQEIVHIP